MKRTTNSKPAASAVDQIHASKAQMAAVRRAMTFLVPLTADERRRHQSARIGIKTLRAIGNRVEAARQHRHLLPASFDLRKLERDAALTGALAEYQELIDEIRRDINDTLLAAGYRAVTASATACGYLKVAANSAESLKRTVEKLAARGSRPSAKGLEPAEVPKLSEPARLAAPANLAISPEAKVA